MYFPRKRRVSEKKKKNILKEKRKETRGDDDDDELMIRRKIRMHGMDSTCPGGIRPVAVGSGNRYGADTELFRWRYRLSALNRAFPGKPSVFNSRKT